MHKFFVSIILTFKKCSACFWPNFSEIDHICVTRFLATIMLQFPCVATVLSFYSCSLNEMTCLDASTQICLRSKTHPPPPLQITTSPRRCFCNNNNALKGILKTRPCLAVQYSPKDLCIIFVSIQSTFNKDLN